MIILRFLLTGFLCIFLAFLGLLVVSEGSAAFNSPVCSSKLKAWVGFKKSSAELLGVGFGATADVADCFVIAGRLGEDLRVAGFFTVVRAVELRVVVVRTVGFLAVVLTATLVVVLVVAFRGEEGRVAEILARRVVRPSIDLFLSIVYNYSIMATKITKKQLAVLNFLEDFTEEKGYSPSYREIQEGLGLSSVSAVAEHIDNLVAKGALKKVPGAARSLEVLDYKHESTVNLFRAKLMDCSEEDAKVLKSAAEILGLDLG